MGKLILSLVVMLAFVGFASAQCGSRGCSAQGCSTAPKDSDIEVGACGAKSGCGSNQAGCGAKQGCGSGSKGCNANTNSTNNQRSANNRKAPKKTVTEVNKTVATVKAAESAKVAVVWTTEADEAKDSGWLYKNGTLVGYTDGIAFYKYNGKTYSDAQALPWATK